MGAQTTYRYNTPIGHAGGIIDLAPYAIDTFLNDEANGVMKHGIGVVRGATPGKTVCIPTAEATATQFEGITVNNLTTEYDLDGEIRILNANRIGVMRYGRIYGRVATGIEPAYGDAVYVLTSGEEAGCLTNVATDAIAVKARFVGEVDTCSQIAPVELFNQAQV